MEYTMVEYSTNYTNYTITQRYSACDTPSHCTVEVPICPQNGLSHLIMYCFEINNK